MGTRRARERGGGGGGGETKGPSPPPTPPTHRFKEGGPGPPPPPTHPPTLPLQSPTGVLLKIGLQCELVWDLSQIKVDALWINQRNCSFTVNIYTFCRVVVMNVE